MKKNKTNRKTRTVGNGEGSFYYSEVFQCDMYQFYDTYHKRKTMKQRKNESKKQFRKRVTEIKSSINNGTYIEKRKETIALIIDNHIRQKFNDGITKGNAYNRDKETLQQIKKCCSNFVNKPIQNVTLKDIQKSKEKMKEYASSGIDKMWRLLKKAFAIASSPSIRLIPYNLMEDENLKKPVSNKKTKKVKPLSDKEREKLRYVLDNQERNNKFRNIVKMEWETGMRIGEVLAFSIDDINKSKKVLHIYRTLTKNENGDYILGEHTKTYNKKTEIDEGERNFPINAEINEIIEEQFSAKISNMYNLLFWDYENNKFVSEKVVNSWLRRINKKYNISSESLHNHRLRHDRITQWKEAGMDLKAIQYLAGHVEGSSITEKVYIDISQEYAFEELSKAN